MSADLSTAAFIDAQIGPREVGGRYWSHQWGEEYEVTALDRAPADWRNWTVTCAWASGSTTTHSTPWDARDRVVSQP